MSDSLPRQWEKEARRVSDLVKIRKFEIAGYVLAGVSALALCDLIFDWGYVSYPLEDLAGLNEGNKYVVARTVEYVLVGWGLYAGVGMAGVGRHLRITGARE